MAKVDDRLNIKKARDKARKEILRRSRISKAQKGTKKKRKPKSKFKKRRVKKITTTQKKQKPIVLSDKDAKSLLQVNITAKERRKKKPKSFAERKADEFAKTGVADLAQLRNQQRIASQQLGYTTQSKNPMALAKAGGGRYNQQAPQVSGGGSADAYGKFDLAGYTNLVAGHGVGQQTKPTRILGRGGKWYNADTRETQTDTMGGGNVLGGGKKPPKPQPQQPQPEPQPPPQRKVVDKRKERYVAPLPKYSELFDPRLQQLKKRRWTGELPSHTFRKPVRDQVFKGYKKIDQPLPSSSVLLQQPSYQPSGVVGDLIDEDPRLKLLKKRKNKRYSYDSEIIFNRTPLDPPAGQEPQRPPPAPASFVSSATSSSSDDSSIGGGRGGGRIAMPSRGVIADIPEGEEPITFFSDAPSTELTTRSSEGQRRYGYLEQDLYLPAVYEGHTIIEGAEDEPRWIGPSQAEVDEEARFEFFNRWGNHQANTPQNAPTQRGIVIPPTETPPIPLPLSVADELGEQEMTLASPVAQEERQEPDKLKPEDYNVEWNNLSVNALNDILDSMDNTSSKGGNKGGKRAKIQKILKFGGRDKLNYKLDKLWMSGAGGGGSDIAGEVAEDVSSVGSFKTATGEPKKKEIKTKKVVKAPEPEPELTAPISKRRGRPPTPVISPTKLDAELNALNEKLKDVKEEMSGYGIPMKILNQARSLNDIDYAIAELGAYMGDDVDYETQQYLNGVVDDYIRTNVRRSRLMGLRKKGQAKDKK